MMSWLSGHWITILVVIFAIVFGRSLLRSLIHWGNVSAGRTHGIAYCNHCGWKGSVARTRRECKRCGSLKLTLQTN